MKDSISKVQTAPHIALMTNENGHVSKNVGGLFSARYIHMISSTVLNNDVCWYSWPSGNTQTHPPRVGAEIKVTYNILAQNRIRGVGATVAS